MAEEHRCQAPRLCANNCGFFGSPATLNLCSKCYRDLQLKEQQSSSAKHALNQTLISTSSSTSTSTSSVLSRTVDLSLREKPTTDVKEEEKPVQQTAVSRCMTCTRRVGLMGFKCRCESLFCGVHRYPEQHGCTFDFKGMGKEEIAKANPVVKAEKLQKRI